MIQKIYLRFEMEQLEETIFIGISSRPVTIRKFKLEYYYSNTTIRKKPIVSTGCNYTNIIRIVIIPNSTRSSLALA